MRRTYGYNAKNNERWMRNAYQSLIIRNDLKKNNLDDKNKFIIRLFFEKINKFFKLSFQLIHTEHHYF